MCTVSTTAKAATSKSCDRHVSKHDQAWHHRFKQLVQYKQFHGNTFVPLRFKPNPPLGRWVNRQREALNKKNLSWEREEMLNEIGFAWNQNSASPSVAWNARFEQLVTFKNEYGHTNVPQNYTDAKYNGLGGWVNRQRTARSKYSLLQSRIDKLDTIDFSWNMKNNAWDMRFDQLVKYKQEKGNCDVPHSFKNTELSKWVQKQRYLYTLKGRGTQTNLTDERQTKLTELGFKWNPSNSSWDKQYRRLCAYKALYGHCSVPRPYLQDTKLSNWVFNQRSEYSRKQRGLKNSLTAEREAKLSAIDFRWTIVAKKKAALSNLVTPEHARYSESKTHAFQSSESENRGFDSESYQERLIVSKLLELKG